MIMPAADPAPRTWLDNKVVRYALASIGPVSASVTQFALSLIMLRVLSPGAFGTFTLLLVASQLSWGVWSALLCAPLPVFLSSNEPGRQAEGEATLLGANLLGALAAFPAFAGLAAALDLHAAAIACFAGYGALALMRWFARAFAYVHGQQLRTMTSDIVYSLGVLGTLGLGLLVLRWEAQTACYAALLAGAALGLLPFGASYFRRQFAPFGAAVLRRYRPIWRGQSRWALLGVVTTEATANAHVYLITLLQGPTAFAPIAAASLLIRPVNVAQNALSDFERPQMARLIGQTDWRGLRHSAAVFKLALGAIWVLTALATLVLFLTWPRLLFPAEYDLGFVSTAACLWTIFAALRLWQTPPGILLQAAGEFRPLAVASAWSSLVSILAVVALVLAAGALWSILGLIAGAGLFLFWTLRAVRRWWARVEPATRQG